MFKVRATMNFFDVLENKKRKIGDEFIVEDLERVKTLVTAGPQGKGVVKILSAKKRCNNLYKGKKVLLYQNVLMRIGGIETFIRNLTKHYNDRNFTLAVMYTNNADVLDLSEYVDVIVDEDTTKYECDICILGNYNGDSALPRIKAETVYQMVHTDWEGLKKSDPYWTNFKWRTSPRINKFISVSDITAAGLKKEHGYDSEVIYNILDLEPKKEDMKIFITLSRATVEKGIHRIIAMAEAFKKQNKRFLWYLCCSLEQAPPRIRNQIKAIPEFIIIPTDNANKDLITHCDYLVQLSDTESFCYSAYEALQRKVPVILTRFPEAYNIVQHGKNGYLVDMDLADLDIDAIFEHKPTEVDFKDRCDYDKWEKVFKGEL